MIQFIQANKSSQDLPTMFEGARMGGEWPKLEILDKFEVIVLRETDTVSKIFPPRQYQPLILEELHKSGRKEDSVFLRTHLHYTWPSIQKDVKSHVDSCPKCLELMPSKSQARSSGLNIPIKSLQPMDWVSTDLAQKVLSNGRKVNFLIIVDRAIGFLRVYHLRGTKTYNVIDALQDYNNTYCGPLYWLTSDGGPQFAGANAAIKKWCEEASILHTLSAAFNPEGNGEAERAV